MNRWIIVAGLLVLNGILGIGVYQRLVERSTLAQMGGIGGPKPDIISVAGVSNGQPVIYVMDATTGLLQARRIDLTNQRFDPPIARNVGADLQRIR